MRNATSIRRRSFCIAAELVGENPRPVRTDLADGDHLVVADAGPQHQGDAFDLGLEAGGETLVFLGRAGWVSRANDT